MPENPLKFLVKGNKIVRQYSLIISQIFIVLAYGITGNNAGPCLKFAAPVQVRWGLARAMLPVFSGLYDSLLAIATLLSAPQAIKPASEL